MTVTVITPLDRTSPTFKTEVDALFMTKIPLLSSELSTLQADVYENQLIATGAASDAMTAAAAAVPAATTAVAAKDISVALKPIQSPTPPSFPIAGSQWTDSNTGRHYIYYVDDSSQWVEVGAGIVDNPTQTLGQLAEADGGILMGYQSDAIGSTKTNAKKKLDEFTSVEDFFIAGEVDAAPMFNRAAMCGKKTIRAVGRTYALGSVPVDIQSGQSWELKGSTFTMSGTTAIIFRASGVDDWSITGPFKIIGDGMTEGSAAGVYVVGCNRGRIENPGMEKIKGWGIKIDPGTPSGSSRGDQVQIVAPQIHKCYFGIANTAGTGAEYCTIMAPMISGCEFPVVIYAGNTSILGGNIVDNVNGLYVGPGVIDGHGICSGVNINHNTNYNVHIVDVTYGFTLSCCHMFGDSSSTGFVWITNSKGININGGILASPVLVDGTSAFSAIRGAMIPGTLSDSMTTATRQKLFITDCFKPNGGAWELNDPAPVAVAAGRGTSAQSVSAGDITLIFNGETLDNRGAYDASTGIFTAPMAGTYQMTANCTFLGTGLSDSYIAFKKNGTTLNFALASFSSTLLIASGGVVVDCVAGDTLIVTSTITGTSPTLATGTSNMSIRMLA